MGFTLVESLLALTVLTISLLAVFNLYMTYVKSERFTEERRLALQSAVEKIDSLRQQLAAGQSLDQIYANYKPTTAVTDPTNMPLAAFKVTGLTTASTDPLRRNYVGTISLIIDETPNEQDYGVDYSVSPPVLNLGADINGNSYYSDAYPSGTPAPFPLDINANGNTTDNPMTSGFHVLPVVVTVHWVGVFGAQRIDLFTILFPDKQI